jgi:PAS domain-containing protein
MLRLRHLMSKDFSVRSFVAAGAVMAAAVAVRAALDSPFPDLPPFITLYPAVALGGLLCGPAAGGAAALAGVLAADFFWIPPRSTLLPLSLTDGVATALFMAASAVVLWVAGVLRAELTVASVAKVALDLGLAAGGIGTWQIDLETSRISASSAAHALHGLPESDRRTTAEDWLRGVPPDDAQAARAALQAAVADGTVATYTYRVFGAPDEPRWISATSPTRSGPRRSYAANASVCGWRWRPAPWRSGTTIRPPARRRSTRAMPRRWASTRRSGW